MAESMDERRSMSGKQRAIKTRSVTKDVRVVDKAHGLSGHLKETYIRTKENTKSVLDDSRDDGTNYAVDRSEDTAEAVVYETERGVRKGNEKVKDQLEKRVRRYLENRDEIRNGNARQVHESHQVSQRIKDPVSSEEVNPLKEQYKKNIAAERKNANSNMRTFNHSTPSNIKTADNIKGIRTVREGKTIKTTAKSSGKATIKTAEHSVKGAEKSVKTAESTAKATVKTAKTTAKAAQQSAKAAAKASEKAAIAAKNAAQVTARAASASAKAIATAVKALAGAFWKVAAAAGAAIVAAAPFIVLGVVIISAAVLLTGDTAHHSDASDSTSAIAEINTEWQAQLDEITSGFEDTTMEGGRATWPQIFSLYTAKSDETAVESWDEIIDLKQIFWEMNWIHYDIYAVVEAEKAPEKDVKILMRSVDATFLCSGAGQVIRQEDETYQNKEKLEDIAKQYKKRKIHSAITVTVNHYSVEEMDEKLGFTEYQLEHAQALLEKQFASFWQERLYGVAGADDDIVKVAATQIGNTGGWPYWEYVGFPSRVEWCACFVSWCAGQCGYIDKGLFINTGYPPGQVDFFQNEGHWMDGSGTPSPGMIIFFDWYHADFADHVGIVEYVEDGYVHTIEGNSGDAVRRGTWAIGDSQIQGYGWILEK
ncbi:MAG: CHAP domain-containing protein [Parasporobacterium sp.]|nr:CHAP domain-containing protein [Parasporobacterium sp.]